MAIAKFQFGPIDLRKIGPAKFRNFDRKRQCSIWDIGPLGIVMTSGYPVVPEAVVVLREMLIGQYNNAAMARNWRLSEEINALMLG